MGAGVFASSVVKESGLTDLALVLLVLAIPLSARAVLEVAWYRYHLPKRAAGTWIAKGQHKLGLPRPMLIGAGCGVLLAAVALLVLVGGAYGAGEVVGLIFLALVALVVISIATAAAVWYFRWVVRR
jgi:hypothetical protein